MAGLLRQLKALSGRGIGRRIAQHLAHVAAAHHQLALALGHVRVVVDGAAGTKQQAHRQGDDGPEEFTEGRHAAWQRHAAIVPRFQ